MYCLSPPINYLAVMCVLFVSSNQLPCSYVYCLSPPIIYLAVMCVLFVSSNQLPCSYVCIVCLLQSITLVMCVLFVSSNQLPCSCVYCLSPPITTPATITMNRGHAHTIPHHTTDTVSYFLTGNKVKHIF